MSTRSTSRAAARLLALALALTTLTGLAACIESPTDPAGEDTKGQSAEWTLPRLDESDSTDTGSDTTGTRKCDHTQGWGCA